MESLLSVLLALALNPASIIVYVGCLLLAAITCKRFTADLGVLIMPLNVLSFVSFLTVFGSKTVLFKRVEFENGLSELPSVA
jgi:cytochrome c oxidase subunit IV